MPRLTGTMTPEERVRVVVALDHDGRQPQTTLAMSLRNLRILVNDLDANTTVRALRKSIPSVKAELVAVQAAVRQIIEGMLPGPSERAKLDAAMLHWLEHSAPE